MNGFGVGVELTEDQFQEFDAFALAARWERAVGNGGCGAGKKAIGHFEFSLGRVSGESEFDVGLDDSVAICHRPGQKSSTWRAKQVRTWGFGEPSGRDGRRWPRMKRIARISRIGTDSRARRRRIDGCEER